jgi:hypothetical protein
MVSRTIINGRMGRSPELIAVHSLRGSRMYEINGGEAAGNPAVCGAKAVCSKTD